MDALKRIEKIVRDEDFDEKKNKPGLKFNPGLALVGLRTTRPCNISISSFLSGFRSDYLLLFMLEMVCSTITKKNNKTDGGYGKNCKELQKRMIAIS